MSLMRDCGSQAGLHKRPRNWAGGRRPREELWRTSQWAGGRGDGRELIMATRGTWEDKEMKDWKWPLRFLECSPLHLLSKSVCIPPHPPSSWSPTSLRERMMPVCFGKHKWLIRTQHMHVYKACPCGLLHFTPMKTLWSGQNWDYYLHLTDMEKGPEMKHLAQGHSQFIVLWPKLLAMSTFKSAFTIIIKLALSLKPC